MLGTPLYLAPELCRGEAPTARSDVYALGATVLIAALSVTSLFIQTFSGALVTGVVTWIVAHALAVPLRPLRVAPAIRHAWKQATSLLQAVTLSSLITTLGSLCCLLPGLWFSARYVLITPSIMME